MLSNGSETKFDKARTWRAIGVRRAAQRVGAVLRSALPQACALCAARSGNAMLCAACAAQMPKIAEACPRCALASRGNLVCGACLVHAPPYASTIAAWCYAFPADRLLQAFKYGGRLALAEPLALALVETVRIGSAHRPDRLIAMPLSPRRQRERGFNHAHEIARRVSQHLDIPLGHELRRTRDAPPQAALTLRERARNVRDAFEAGAPMRGRSIAIVDDVMTTGATLAAAARAAHAGGAARVDAWVVARTPAPGDRDQVSDAATTRNSDLRSDP